jgi:antitoxin component of RelBE/YafQ-DinJ toxin-antitoxin module
MKVVTFRIEPELLKKAKKKSKELGRSLSGQIRYLLRKFIDEKETDV